LDAIEGSESFLPDLPIIALPVRAPYLRVRSGIVTVPSESIVALVIPE
jgi:hypothetical protein